LPWADTLSAKRRRPVRAVARANAAVPGTLKKEPPSESLTRDHTKESAAELGGTAALFGKSCSRLTRRDNRGANCMFRVNTDSPPSQGLCHALIAVGVTTGSPSFGRPLLRVRQSRCACCSTPLPVRWRGRPSQYCSARCRVRAARATARAGEASARPPIPAAPGAVTKFPVELMGRAYRWPGAARIDRELRRNIMRAEIGQ
jgi:hypothetical protein